MARGISYSFVKIYLKNLNTKIYVGNEQILKTVSDTELKKNEIKKIKTEIKLGLNFLDEESVDTTTITYAQLRRMGYGVVKEEIPKEKRVGLDRYRWIISSANHGVIYQIRDHKIEYDPERGIARLIGPKAGGNTTRKGIGEWTTVKRRITREKDFSPADFAKMMMYDQDNLNLSKFYTNTWQGIDNDLQIRTQVIPEISLIVNNENELVCLEQRSDMQKIGFVGDTSTGKSLGLVRVMAHIFYKWDTDWIGMYNDCWGQFHELGRPMDTFGFVADLKKVGEEPVALPVINLFMAAPNIPPLFRESEGISFNFVLSFKTFLNMYNFFSYGIGSWGLDKAERYLDTYRQYILDCRTSEDVREVLFSNTPDEKQRENLKGMFMKWSNTFGDIFKHKFLDVYYDDALSKPTWRCVTPSGTFEGSPMMTCMYAGIIPVLNTNYAKDYSYFRNWEAFLLREILQYQKQHRYDDKRRIWVCVDEIGDIFKSKSSINNNLLSVFNEIFVQGRGQRIGCLYSTTSFAGLPQDITQNTSTVVCSQLFSSAENRKAVAKAFNLTKEEENQLADLDSSKREVIVIQRHPFIVYDRNGNRKVGERFYRGYLIPPNCNTFHPEKKYKKKEVEEDEDVEEEQS